MSGLHKYNHNGGSEQEQVTTSNHHTSDRSDDKAYIVLEVHF